MVLNIQSFSGAQREVNISHDPIYYRLTKPESQKTSYGRAQVIPRREELAVCVLSWSDQLASLRVREYDIDKKDGTDGGVVTGFEGGTKQLRILERASQGKENATIPEHEFRDKYEKVLNRLYT